MIRRWSKNISKKQHTIKEHKYLKIFGSILHRKEFWNLNRNSVSRGVSVGIFWAFMPLPFQMIFATLCALIFRGNVAISVSMVWITNPVTMPVIFYGTYRLGNWMLGREGVPFEFELSFEWMVSRFDLIMFPMLLGSVIVGAFFSVLAYYLIHYLWYRGTKYEVRKRNKRFKIFE